MAVYTTEKILELRLMICGNIGMLADTRRILDSAGFEISPQIGIGGDYVIERAFTESLALERKVAGCLR